MADETDFGEQLQGDEPVACDNCPWKGTAEQLNAIQDLWQRVEPGGTMPAGECPKCGALAYLVTHKEQ